MYAKTYTCIRMFVCVYIYVHIESFDKSLRLGGLREFFRAAGQLVELRPARRGHGFVLIRGPPHMGVHKTEGPKIGHSILGSL